MASSLGNLNVLVVGASIAGPTTAYWLARAGANVTVIERFSDLRKGGQAVDIRTMGVATMRKMGDMESKVRAKLAPLDGLGFVREDGRPYGVLRPTGNPDQQSLLSEYEIFRGDLSKIIYDMTKDNKKIKYVFGEQIKALHNSEKQDGQIGVDFANNYPSAKYDLVVACDGSTSRTRALGLGCGVRDYTTRMNMWSAYFSTKKDYVKGDRIGYAHCAVPGKMIAAQLDPAVGNRVAMMKLYPRDEEDPTAAFREASKKGEGALKEYVAAQYKGMGWITDEALEDLKDSDDFYANEWIQVKLPTLSKGRFVLVGDAGYGGAPGAGTSLAMAGGYFLAGELSRHKGDVRAGLEAYEARMRPLLDDLQKIPNMGFMAPQTQWGLNIRNGLFAFLSWSRLFDFLQRFGGYWAGAFASAENYPLPEYNFGEGETEDSRDQLRH